MITGGLAAHAYAISLKHVVKEVVRRRPTLGGVGLRQWESVNKAKGNREMRLMKWEEMKELAMKKFYPQNEINRVERDFLTLKASNMTHRQYTSKFDEMSRIVPNVVTLEERMLSATFKDYLRRDKKATRMLRMFVGMWEEAHR
ncbi:hypothetical protein L1987_84423 [Smallanthus sonchifolius]|uniref:Uncharacterized protein n=1 Tax=Smallanthus sonchifolius TaxID=185202 RepID=A0ACB8YFM0_9ASTR|nr:hypothetical protein L1987_84423 [Smallanthus sonchifolius]